MFTLFLNHGVVMFPLNFLIVKAEIAAYYKSVRKIVNQSNFAEFPGERDESCVEENGKIGTRLPDC